MKSPITNFIKLFLFLILTLLFTQQTLPCTIVSAIAANGHVWNANNEDGPFGVGTFINVFPKSENAKYGYYTLSYFSPALGKGGGMQGGTNEAGLTFDFNAIDKVENFDFESKKAFPQGNNAILPHILGNMSSVKEVMDFFETYWFTNGFNDAQMHVADSQGNFAIISASGMLLAEKGQPLVSTNFDICGKEDGSSCWRYPLATFKLENFDVNLNTMMSICQETAQKNGSTMYSNIQNLSTGELWFFSKYDPNIVLSTTIQDLLSKGKKSYSFSDLKSLVEDRLEHVWDKPASIALSETVTNKIIGKYHNSFSGEIVVKDHEQGIEIFLQDGTSTVFQAYAENKFFLPEEDAFLEFFFDEEAKREAFNLYENGFWALRAWKD